MGAGPERERPAVAGGVGALVHLDAGLGRAGDAPAVAVLDRQLGEVEEVLLAEQAVQGDRGAGGPAEESAHSRGRPSLERRRVAVHPPGTRPGSRGHRGRVVAHGAPVTARVGRASVGWVSGGRTGASFPANRGGGTDMTEHTDHADRRRSQHGWTAGRQGPERGLRHRHRRRTRRPRGRTGRPARGAAGTARRTGCSPGPGGARGLLPRPHRRARRRSARRPSTCRPASAGSTAVGCCARSPRVSWGWASAGSCWRPACGRGCWPCRRCGCSTAATRPGSPRRPTAGG